MGECITFVPRLFTRLRTYNSIVHLDTVYICNSLLAMVVLLFASHTNQVNFEDNKLDMAAPPLPVSQVDSSIWQLEPNATLLALDIELFD